jgi:hypothetical protein
LGPLSTTIKEPPLQELVDIGIRAIKLQSFEREAFVAKPGSRGDGARKVS